MRGTSRKRLLMTSAALTIALAATACGSADPDAETDTAADSTDAASQDLSGSIAVSGSSTVEPISALNAELFRDQNPGVEITVDGPGTGDGFELFCQGETDISDASRPIADDEIEICEDNGVEYTELKVAVDGMAVLTSPDNDQVSCLSFTDLYALIGPESEGFANWSDADDLAGELGDSQGSPFPDAPLDIYAPGEESGTYDSFVELAIEGIAEERGEEAQTRADYSANADDNIIVQGITGSTTSLGWVGYAFFAENEGALKAIEVDGGDGCVSPNGETIASNEYPLARDLFIYVNNANADENPALQAFIDFYVSEEGRASVSEVGYVDLTDEDWQATVDVWESR
jgi:phosphate transport system substrate-binding protein